MLSKIKIIIGEGKKKEKPVNNYDSFMSDLKSSSNKTRPSLDDHNLIAKLVKLLRGDKSPDALPSNMEDCGPEKPVEAGIIEQIKRKVK